MSMLRYRWAQPHSATTSITVDVARCDVAYERRISDLSAGARARRVCTKLLLKYTIQLQSSTRSTREQPQQRWTEGVRHERNSSRFGA